MNHPNKAVDLKSWEEKIKNYTEEDSEVSAEVVESDETLHLTLGMVGHPVSFFLFPISFFKKFPIFFHLFFLQMRGVEERMNNGVLKSYASIT